MDLLVSTIAGCGKLGNQNGKAENATFEWPSGVCISDDDKIYVIDSYNYTIRMISDGMVSTVAGCGKKGYLDGKADEAMFIGPIGVYAHDDNIYVLDFMDNRIRMISDGFVSTIAGNGEKGFQDGKAENATFYLPTGICISEDGKIYIVDSGNSCVRMISDGIVSTIAGNGQIGYKDGKAGEAMFNCPTGICISNNGDLFVTDSSSNCIRMISNGIVSTIAGNGKQGFQDGKAEDAMFDNPTGICICHDNKIYVMDFYNYRIRMISDGMVSTIAGSGESGFKDGRALNAMFDLCDAMCISNDDRIFISDSANHSIRMLSGLPHSLSASFELSSLLNESTSLSDMTLTINNHQYHLHTAVVHSMCPMIIKHKSIIEDAKISHESLQTMFEMIYSNDTIKIRKQRDQYEMTDLTHLVELIWLFESFEINNESFVKTCIKQLKREMKYFMEHDEHNSTIEILKNGLIHILVASSQSHGLQTTKLVEINHFINQNNENQEKNPSKSNNNKIATMSMHDMFLLFGLHTEPRVVDQQQIKSETVLKYLETPNTELKTQPDYTIMTHDRSYSIKCHKVILYAKWSYFRRMIESGLLESASGEMIMSEDWNATRLYDFVKYLYTHEVGFESVEDCRWLLENAGLYELIETQIAESPVIKRTYQFLIDTCRAKSTEVV